MVLIFQEQFPRPGVFDPSWVFQVTGSMAEYLERGERDLGERAEEACRDLGSQIEHVKDVVEGFRVLLGAPPTSEEWQPAG